MVFILIDRLARRQRTRFPGLQVRLCAASVTLTVAKTLRQFSD